MRANFTAPVAAALIAAFISNVVFAHSASDAYLTLETQQRTAGSGIVIRGQWDIALRDLHFAVRLDDDGDGNITWGELRKKQSAIARYAYPNLLARGDGKPCTINPTRQAVTDHADGSYVALFFDLVCAGAPQRLTLDYRLFFNIDPSHRGILLLRSGNTTSTALVSPENAKIEWVP